MDLEYCPSCGRSLGLFLPDEELKCPGCGAMLNELPSEPVAGAKPAPTSPSSPSPKPVWKPPQSKSQKPATIPLPPASTPPPTPPQPAAKAATPPPPSAPRLPLRPKKEPFDWSIFLCPQIVITLVCVGLGMFCLFPLGLFFNFAKGFIMLGGLGIMLWGVFWSILRYRKHYGENFPDYLPWFTRGGILELAQYVVLAFYEPRVFGPPAFLVVLGTIIAIIPAFMPGGMPR